MENEKQNQNKIERRYRKKKMKILTSLIAMFLVISLFSVPVLAQDSTDSVDIVVEDDETSDEIIDIAEAEAEGEAEAELVTAEEDVIPEDEDGGVGPGHIFWGLDRAIERIELALTLGKAAKAKKGLAHARERLLEVRERIKAKKLAQAEKAQAEHEEIMEEVMENIDEITSEDPEEELEDKLELEDELEEYEDEIGQVEAEIETELTEDLDEDEQEKVDNIMKVFKLKSGEALGDIEMDEKTLRDRIKAQTGKSDVEIDKFIAQKRARYAKQKAKRAALAIKRFNRITEVVESKIQMLEEKGIDAELLEEKVSVLKERMAEKIAQKAGQFKEAEQDETEDEEVEGGEE